MGGPMFHGLMRSFRLRVWLSLMLLVPCLPSQDPSGALAEALGPRIARAEKAGIAVGVSAVWLDSGEVVLASRAEERRVPASVQKLLTVIASQLGPGGDHRLFTDLLAHGSLEDGVLKGSLRLRGEGDPTLEAGRDLAQFVSALKAAGVTRITGDLLVDDRLIRRPRQAPGWPDADPATHWMAGPAALALDGGTALLVIEGQDRPRVRVEPQGTSLRVRNDLSWSAEGKRSVAIRTPEGDADLLIRGRVPRRAGEAHRAAIADPGIFFGEALAAAIEREGIPLEGQVRRPEDEELQSGGLIVRRHATRVSELWEPILGRSDNHWAEMLFVHLGAERFGQGSFATGRSAVFQHLREAGWRPGEGVVIVDGSGLSRQNRASPRSLTDLLRIVAADPNRRDALEDALAHGGETGTTLKRRLKRIGTRVRAKTGTLSGVKALAGLFETRSGRRIAFAILAESERGRSTGTHRALQDAIVRAFDTL